MAQEITAEDTVDVIDRDYRPPVDQGSDEPLLGLLLGSPRCKNGAPIAQQRGCHRYSEDVRVGAVLPQSGVVYREVPAEYGVQGYSYTIVNDRPVLVEPRTRRIVQIIE